MSHYEQRLAEDLDAIRSAMESVTNDVVSALDRCVRGIREGDRDLLYEVVLDDHAINRKVRALDSACHAFVAIHLPAAGHLRFVSSVLRLSIALERSGDYAVTICRVVLQLKKPLGPDIVDRVAELSELSSSMLRDAVQAFLAGDADLAQDTRVRGITIDRVYDEMFHALVEEQPRRPSMELASLLTIFGKIERVSDQAKNICEETVFASTGALKGPKIYRILFLDERNDLLGQLAAAIGRKSFQNAGVFSSAGWAPAQVIDPRLLSVADRFGLDAGGARPVRAKTKLPDYPIDYHVIVAINSGDGEKLPHIPYHTVLRRWNIAVPSVDDGPELEAAFEPIVRDLSSKIRWLMERLRGPD